MCASEDQGDQNGCNHATGNAVTKAEVTVLRELLDYDLRYSTTTQVQTRLEAKDVDELRTPQPNMKLKQSSSSSVYCRRKIVAGVVGAIVVNVV